MKKMLIIIILALIFVVESFVFILKNNNKQEIEILNQNDDILSSEVIEDDFNTDVKENTNVPVKEYMERDNNFIFCCYDQWWDEYKDMETEYVGIYYRTRGIGNIPTIEMSAIESKNSKYYYTSASSDYASYDKQSIYRNLENEVIPSLEREQCKGLYMHEVLTWLSSQNDWNWDKAVQQFDWSWANRTIYESKIRNKKVIWSEPSYAWQTVYTDSSLEHWFEEWSDTLVIMFATNFPTQINASKTYAERISEKFNIELGESLQDWYFVDQDIETTSLETFNLCRYGFDNGARYFQVEGTSRGMSPASVYMDGVKNCIDSITS